MKVAIVGSREFRGLDRVDAYIKSLSKGTVVVSGAARGVDRRAAAQARLRELEVVEYYAEWWKYSKQAGFMRNTTIVENSDKVVAFWDGKSKGTLDTITKALYADNVKEVIIYKEI